ncbi:MAG: T9SS type A sorting domain-containing protein [Ignavibacteriales bacterium]|nr:T9SS type A sorting domain-containing protein [Ignavibacteriales bacterium]
MKKNLLLVLFVIFAVNLIAQDYVFFSNSPTSNFYDPSWGYANLPSSVERINNEKFPVDNTHQYSGLNCLRLKWNSKASGDWGIAVAEQGWLPHDISTKDYLTFRVYTESTISNTDLPLIYLEDLNNNKTAKQNLLGFSNSISANTWTKISVPLNVFIQAPGLANPSIIKTIFFGQSTSDGIDHTLYIDEIRMIKAAEADTISPSVPTNIKVTGFDRHFDVTWTPNTETDLAGYRIYRLESSAYKIIGEAEKDENFFSDYVGLPPQTNTYKVLAYDLSGNQSELSVEASSSTKQLTDDELLGMVQEATFRYFWDYAHPVSGLVRERRGSGETVTSGGSGFGIMAIPVGVERGFITRDQAVERILKILNFLNTKADRFHGAYSHWLDGTTGKVIPFSQKDNGGDLVETAYLIQGLLSARQYFNQNNSDEEQIRNIVTSIWEAVEWDWYRRFTSSNYLYWHWSPNYNWDMNMTVTGPSETMITYLLAIASPTHAVPPSLFRNGFAGGFYKNGKSFYGIPLYVGWDYGGPLFFAHYSFLGFDPRGKKDMFTNYFVNNRNHSLINHAYCAANPKHYSGYDANTWGLTASDDPFGYGVHEPTNDNGTITPSAALSSMPYSPEESMNALKSFYFTYGKNLWGAYGFKDAFNLSKNWYADSYLAIDQGPIIVMIENYRSGLLWKNFMANPEIQPMLDAIGFVKDTTTSVENIDEPNSFKLIGNFPNPFNPATKIKFSLKDAQNIKVIIYDMLGRKIKSFEKGMMTAGLHEIEWNSKSDLEEPVSSGIYLYSINGLEKSLTGKMILQK